MSEEIKIVTKDDNTTIKVLKVLEGIKGDKGDKGDTGEQGPKGDTGEISQQQLDEGLALKEDVANKVSSFQATTDDEHYPSEKLVKDSLNTLDTNKANIDLDNLSNSGKSKVAELSYPDYNDYIDLTLGASGTVYTASCSGQVYIRLLTTGWVEIDFIDDDDNFISHFTPYKTSSWSIGIFPIGKGQKFIISYEKTTTVDVFRLIKAKGEI